MADNRYDRDQDLRREVLGAVTSGGRRFVRDDRHCRQLLAVPSKGAPHDQHPAAGIAMGEQVFGEPQRPQRALIGDHASRLQELHRRGANMVDDQPMVYE
jgi:hypothetical protein